MPAEFDDAEVQPWVMAHGSERLLKARQAHLLDASKGVYRAERLAMERPGWNYLDLENLTHKERKDRYTEVSNPTEDELDALLHAREVYSPEITIKRWRQVSHFHGHEGVLVERFLGRTAYISVKDYLAREAVAK